MYLYPLVSCNAKPSDHLLRDYHRDDVMPVRSPWGIYAPLVIILPFEVMAEDQRILDDTPYDRRIVFRCFYSFVLLLFDKKTVSELIFYFIHRPSSLSGIFRHCRKAALLLLLPLNNGALALKQLCFCDKL